MVTAVVNLALVDRWIHIVVAADGALALFFHVSDTVFFPLPVALRPLGAAGGPTTMRVKDWMAAGLTPFLAVILNVYVPPLPAAGVPASVAVPSLLSLNLTPRGSPPFSDKAGRGHATRRDGKGPSLAGGEGGAGRARRYWAPGER